VTAEPESALIDDRFELGALIGRGAMGDVYRGVDVRLGRDVAVKLLRSDVVADFDAVERFGEEARSAARLSHPSIVTVFDSGEWRGRPFLVMECLPGRTLADEIAHAPLASGSVRRLGAELAAALAAAHDLGVVHRDVKPSNVLLTWDGRAKLADFGIAKSADSTSRTQTGVIVGTPAYLAPERLEGHVATAESDVYALGVVLYEALTGARPFSGDTPIALAHAAHTTRPVPVRERNPAVDAELADAVDAAMARDPLTRPTARGLAALLTREHAGSPAVTQPFEPQTATAVQPPLPTQLSHHGERTSTRARLVAVVAVAAVVVLAATSFGAGDSEDGPPAAPVTTLPASSLPQTLDDALDRLEDSVRP